MSSWINLSLNHFYSLFSRMYCLILFCEQYSKFSDNIRKFYLFLNCGNNCQKFFRYLNLVIPSPIVVAGSGYPTGLRFLICSSISPSPLTRRFIVTKLSPPLLPLPPPLPFFPPPFRFFGFERSLSFSCSAFRLSWSLSYSFFIVSSNLTAHRYVWTKKTIIRRGNYHSQHEQISFRLLLNYATS